jgi:hypothetical protein
MPLDFPRIPIATTPPVEPLWGGAEPGDSGEVVIGKDTYTWRQEDDGVWLSNGRGTEVFVPRATFVPGPDTVDGHTIPSYFGEERTTPEPAGTGPLW